ncbi:hypothetical protein HWV62_9583 [Athelia sp. TMB]|nr:hypothetical protein HWV62_9583 [Athelia sp. TMB]
MGDWKHTRSASWNMGHSRLPLRLTPTRALLALAVLAALLFLSQTGYWYAPNILALPNVLSPAVPALLGPGDPFDDVPPPPFTPPFTLARNSTHAPNPRANASLALVPLARLTAPGYRPACLLTPAHMERYAPLRAAPTPVFLALNLLDAQWPLATLLHELPVILDYLGPGLFVSVLENGSEDRTPAFLGVLARLLDAHGVAYRIEVGGAEAKADKSGGRRIIELAKLRNEVMQPLYDGSAAASAGVERFERVLFLNDIIFCAADILEILYEHDAQHADMTCALDWGSRVVYDRWVLRTMSGRIIVRRRLGPASPSPSYAQPDLLTYFGDPPPDPNPVPQPFPADPPARAALDALAPFQVFSCWNGAVVMPARAFTADRGSSGSDEGDTRGTGRGAVRFRTARNDASAVTERQSECFLVPVDLWKRGMGRVMVVPRASVTYSGDDYAEVRQDGGRLPGTAHPAHVAYRPLPAPGEDTQIQWARAPPAQVAYHDYAWWHAPEVRVRCFGSRSVLIARRAEMGCVG